MRLLLIDDDQDFLDLSEEYLSANKIEVYKAPSGKAGLQILKEKDIHIVILDIMMPEMDGFEVLREINRIYPHLPVIMLTAKEEEIDRILGLEMGADDYICKTCNPRELLARIKAIKRRANKLKVEKVIDPSSEAAVRLDLKKREARVRGKLIELSTTGFEILRVFVENKGIVLSRERIMDLVKGAEFLAYDRSIDVNISRLRQKIELDPHHPTLIKTVRGIGYIFTE